MEMISFGAMSAEDVALLHRNPDLLTPLKKR